MGGDERSGEASGARPGPPRRRWRRHAIAAVAGLLFVEASAFALYWARNGEPLSIGALQSWRERIAAGERAEGNLPDADPQDTHETWVTHPYVGYVLDPDREGFLNRDAVLVHGTDEVPPARREDRLVVGLFGGSVAFHLGVDHAELFLEALRGAFPEREVVLVVPATPSWKQPQMLFSLQWLALRGYRFDLVVELDGFNECVGAAANHRYYRVNAAYPPNYRAFVASKAEGPEYLAAAGELVLLDRGRRERAAWLAGSPLRFSLTANLLWSTFDQGDQARMGELREALLELSAPTSRRYGQRGPVDELGDTEDDPGPLYDELGRVWLESNRHMARLARGIGAELAVFLQPNQYLTGTKPLSAWEREEALSIPHFGAIVRGCYPGLVARGAALEGEGIAFEDLTGIYAEHEETLYRDACCHMNEDGNRILGEVIAQRLRARFEPAGAETR